MLEHTEIHKQYQQMVETLLESFIADVGIDSEAFLKACVEHPDKHQQSTTVSICTCMKRPYRRRYGMGVVNVNGFHRLTDNCVKFSKFLQSDVIISPSCIVSYN